MKRHADILELVERMRPLSDGKSFARLSAFGRTEVRENLSREAVLQLIAQHLRVSGFPSSAQTLESEAKVPIGHLTSSESLLLSHMRMAVKSTEKVFELIAPDPDDDWKDSEDFLRDIRFTGDEDETDINVYEEEESPATIVYADGDRSKIKAATLNQIIRMLTDPAGYEAVQFLTRTCLLTYRSFTTPERFLHKLMQRYDVVQPTSGDAAKWETEIANPIRARVVNVIRKWVEESSFDFSEKLWHVLRNFAQNKVERHNPQLGKSLRKIIDRAQQGKSQMRAPVVHHDPKVPRNVCSPALSYLDIDIDELACQLSLLDFADYQAIRPVELLNLGWSKPRLRHRSPHVNSMANRFNAVSLWCTERIMEEPRTKDRAKIITRLIRLAKALRKLNNFDMALAVLSGLNESSVSRLKQTWELISNQDTEAMGSLDKLFSNDNNRQMYRDTVRRAEPPILPYLGYFLSELTFIEDGNPDVVAGGLINVYKRHLVSETIRHLQTYQQVPYPYHPVPQIQALFQRELLAEDLKRIKDRLFIQSLEHEPRHKE